MRSKYCLAMLVAFFSSSAEAQNRTYNSRETRTAQISVNSRLVFGPFVSMNNDCSGSRTAAIKVLRRAPHGEITLSYGRGRAQFPRGARLARCNGLPVNGSFVLYRPARNFRGTDSLQVRLIFEDGERRIVTLHIRVR